MAHVVGLGLVGHHYQHVEATQIQQRSEGVHDGEKLQHFSLRGEESGPELTLKGYP